MERDVDRLIADDALAVDLDLVDARIGLAAELGDDLAVHAYAAGENELLGGSTRGDATVGEDLLNAFHAALPMSGESGFVARFSRRGWARPR